VTGTPSGAYPVVRRPWASRFRAFWRAPDEFLREAGRTAELLIARLRLALALLVLVFPLGGLAATLGPDRERYVAALLIALLAVLVSVLLLLLVLRGGRERWLPMTTSIVDVSLVSFALLAHAVVRDPGAAMEGRAAFELYFLALAATCLRYDPRVTLVTGAVATLEYLGVSMAAVALGEPLVGGSARWSEPAIRTALLAGATGVNTVIVIGLARQRRLSTADPLTGLFNRRFFDDYLAKEVDRADRYHTPFAVAMVDVDRFKEFNDTFGHPAGDRALRSIARVVQGAVRRSDLVARYGGEEVMVIFRETGAEGAVERVEEIRRAVEDESFSVGRLAEPARITVSAGVASWPEDGLTPEDIVATADRRLFEAKARGRNRVVGPPADGRPPRIALA
jgi:diguanylate cyclase (GGDEF)-like protein